MMESFANQMEVCMSFKQGMFFAAPEAISVNRALFARVQGNTSSLNDFRFVGPRQDRIVTVSLPRPFTDAEAPHEVFISGRAFHRRFDKYYTPQDPSEAEISDFFDLISAEYENSIDLSLNVEVTRRMLDAAGMHQRNNKIAQLRLLDFGCGTGLTARVLARRRRRSRCTLIGCDLSVGMLDRCSGELYDGLIKSQYAHVPGVESGSFDLIMASFVAQYFIDARPLIELTRLLKPNGLLIFNLPRPDYGDVRSPYRLRWELPSFCAGIRIVRREWTLATTKPRAIPVFRVYRQCADTHNLSVEDSALWCEAERVERSKGNK